MRTELISGALPEPVGAILGRLPSSRRRESNPYSQLGRLLLYAGRFLLWAVV